MKRISSLKRRINNTHIFSSSFQLNYLTLLVSIIAAIGLFCGIFNIYMSQSISNYKKEFEELKRNYKEIKRSREYNFNIHEKLADRIFVSILKELSIEEYRYFLTKEEVSIMEHPDKNDEYYRIRKDIYLLEKNQEYEKALNTLLSLYEKNKNDSYVLKRIMNNCAGLMNNVKYSDSFKIKLYNIVRDKEKFIPNTKEYANCLNDIGYVYHKYALISNTKEEREEAFERAQDLYNSAIFWEKNNSIALVNWGNLNLEMTYFVNDSNIKKQLWDKAEEKFIKAINNGLQLPLAWSNWALLDRDRADVEEDDREKWRLLHQSESKMQFAMLYAKKKGYFLIRLADIKYRMGKYSESIEKKLEFYNEAEALFNIARKIDEDIFSSYFYSGIFYYLISEDADNLQDKNILLDNSLCYFDKILNKNTTISEKKFWCYYARALFSKAKIENNNNKRNVILCKMEKIINEGLGKNENHADLWRLRRDLYNFWAELEETNSGKLKFLKEAQKSDTNYKKYSN